jgi:hypothetical protein
MMSERFCIYSITVVPVEHARNKGHSGTVPCNFRWMRHTAGNKERRLL